MDDLIKRLKALEAFLRGEEPLRGANFGEPNPALHKGMFWWRNYLGPMREAAAALSEAQATIARLEALLMEAAPWLDDGDPKSELRLRIDAALSPREGEG